MRYLHKINAKILFLLCLLLQACTVVNSTHQNLVTPTQASASRSTPLVVLTPATQSILPDQLIATPTQLATFEIPTEWIRSQCLKEDANIRQKVDGYLVIKNSNDQIMYFDIHSENMTLVSDENINAEVSPSGKLLAYYPIVSRNQVRDTRLVLLSNAKSIYRVYSRKDDWGAVSWVNDRQLLIEQSKTNSDEFATTNFILLDVFNDTEEILPHDYPNQAHISPPIFWKNVWPVVYDPTLSRVAYAKGGESLPSVVLWDINKEVELSAVNIIDYNSPYPTEPLWSSNGDEFVISAMFEIDRTKMIFGNDLFSVSRDGKLTRLTFFTNETGDSSGIIRKYSWSPDNSHIGMWIKSQDKNLWFGIYDTSYNVLLDYCIKEVFDNLDRPTDVSIVWSPDGRFVLITYANTLGNSESLLVDSFAGTSVRIDSLDGLIPVGWMAGQ